MKMETTEDRRLVETCNITSNHNDPPIEPLHCKPHEILSAEINIEKKKVPIRPWDKQG